MLNNYVRRVGFAAIAGVTAIGLAACGSGSGTSTGSADSKWATAQSAAGGGGMDALVAAAKKEGSLNVIALPLDWTNYGKLEAGFTAKYGIKINQANPGGSSQDEVDAITKATVASKAPDVVDVGEAVAYANEKLFAPYKVASWADIPDNLKESSGTIYNDYSGYMAIGYDSSKVPAITSLDDLLKPAYKGKVALSGDPTGSGEAENSVLYASLIKGGSANDVSKGIDFFGQMKKAGTFVPVQASTDTVTSGQTPVVFGWGYNQASYAAKNPHWKVFADPSVSLAGPYFQAVSKTAPHPAAARLWEEYLYSDAGQNLYLQGFGYPARAAAMITAGTIDKTALAAMPKVASNVTAPSVADLEKVSADLTANWAKTVG